MQILRKKWLVVWKNDMRNLANFDQSTWKCQNWKDFDGIFLLKVEKDDLKIYRGLMCHDNEE